MDYGREVTRGLVLCLALAVTAGAGDIVAPLLREQAWTAASGDTAHKLTHALPECLDVPDDPVVRVRIDTGRALFRSSAVLGGPAARLGLSCNACHTNGQTNADFYLPELTDRPGAADVTSEWSSAVRGDGVMNPRPIPNLVDVGTRVQFGSGGERSLDRFAKGVIHEEFQGAPLPPAAFESLIAYLRGLKSASCPPSVETAVTLQSEASDIRRALAAAEAAEPATASLVLVTAQEAIGQLVERLPPPVFDAERKSFENLARELGALRAQGSLLHDLLVKMKPGWSARFDAAVARTETSASKTYFDENALRAVLVGR